MNWLVFNWYNRTNCILADEMGLGKTVQTVSMLWHLYEREGIKGPFLIIAPLSTIQHWKREFEAWTDMNCVVYHGPSEAREIIRRYEWYYTNARGNQIRDYYKFDALITTFEMIISDSRYLAPIQWKHLTIDEAHRLKNKNSRLLQELRNFHFEDILLLTGTPLQNNTQELWTLLNFIHPDKFE